MLPASPNPSALQITSVIRVKWASWKTFSVTEGGEHSYPLTFPCGYNHGLWSSSLHQALTLWGRGDMGKVKSFFHFSYPLQCIYSWTEYIYIYFASMCAGSSLLESWTTEKVPSFLGDCQYRCSGDDVRKLLFCHLSDVTPSMHNLTNLISKPQKHLSYSKYLNCMTKSNTI